ncbi:MAG: hypothetical protein EA401_08785 [Planctomycetota bacterium]|nr:MAG: hypothetical protein EA401_08785 [Planctomycetota bacterium]
MKSVFGSSLLMLGLAVVLSTGCTRKLMPGVWVTHDAQVVEATPEIVRSDMEFRIAQAIVRSAGEPEIVRVQIAEEPRRLSRRGRERSDGRGRWRWSAVSVRVEVSGGDDALRAQVRQAVHNTLKDHVAGAEAVSLTVSLVARDNS